MYKLWNVVQSVVVYGWIILTAPLIAAWALVLAALVADDGESRVFSWFIPFGGIVPIMQINKDAFTDELTAEML